MRQIEFRLWTPAFRFARVFSAFLAISVLSMGLAADFAAEERAERTRKERLAKIQEDERKIVCVTNIVFHEVRDQPKDVRILTGKTVLEMANDNTSRAKTVCDLGKVKGMFSAIKNVDTPRFTNPVWLGIYWEMSETYYGDRTLPRGWQCVRNFRLSDEKLATLSERNLKQLGITPERKGLEFFDRATMQIAVRGDIAFFAPLKGCAKPSKTL